MKNKLIIFLTLCFVVCLTDKIYAQYGENEKLYAKVSTITPHSTADKKPEPKSSSADYYKTRVCLYFKDGNLIEANLLPNNPDNNDKIFVEINGEIKSFNVEEILKVALNDFPFDKIVGRIQDNDLKQRIDFLIIELQSNPSAQSYIYYYYGTEVSRAFPVVKQRTVINHLRRRGFDSSRITQVDASPCGKKMVIEIWVVQPGDSIPIPKCPR